MMEKKMKIVFVANDRTIRECKVNFENGFISVYANGFYKEIDIEEYKNIGVDKIDFYILKEEYNNRDKDLKTTIDSIKNSLYLDKNLLFFYKNNDSFEKICSKIKLKKIEKDFVKYKKGFFIKKIDTTNNPEEDYYIVKKTIEPKEIKKFQTLEEAKEFIIKKNQPCKCGCGYLGIMKRGDFKTSWHEVQYKKNNNI